jgi:hypothetical protein
MSSTILGLMLLVGVDQAADVVVRERLIQGAIVNVMSRERWESAVLAQMDARATGSGELVDSALRYYDTDIVPLATRYLQMFASQDELLFLASAGKTGETPSRQTLFQLFLFRQRWLKELSDF